MVQNSDANHRPRRLDESTTPKSSLLGNLDYSRAKMVARSCQIVLRLLDEQVDTPRCWMRERVSVF